MAENRNIIRLKKRLPLKFGIDAPTRIAFTEDLSPGGLFVKTVHPTPPGGRTKIEITMSDGNIVLMEGMSRWKKTASPPGDPYGEQKGNGGEDPQVSLRRGDLPELYRRAQN